MNIGTMFSKIGFWGKRHSPELLIASGVLLSVGAIASAIYSTTKLNKTLEPFNKKIDSIKKDLKDDNKIQNKEIDVKLAKKELSATYGKAVLKVGALYLPSALLLGGSVACTIGSHSVMKNRNLALAAACTTLERSYQAYRNRVKEKIGEEVEEKIYKNVYKEEKEIIDPKTGKSKIKKVDVEHIHEDNAWNVMFDDGNCHWINDAKMNLQFLIGMQNYYNELLKRRGYVFLSEIYEDLGFTIGMLGENKSQAAHVLGWIYKPDDPTRNSYIDFGITHPNTETFLPKVTEQMLRNEPSFFLTLNPDGDILTGNNGKLKFTNCANKGYSR